MRGSSPPLSTRPASASAEQLYFDGLAPKALKAARQAATCGSSAARSSPRACRPSSASRSSASPAASLGPLGTPSATTIAAA